MAKIAVAKPTATRERNTVAANEWEGDLRSRSIAFAPSPLTGSADRAMLLRDPPLNEPRRVYRHGAPCVCIGRPLPARRPPLFAFARRICASHRQKQQRRA